MIIGKERQQNVRDIELSSTGIDIEWERYALISTAKLQIFAKNRETTPDLQTFNIKLQKTLADDEDMALQQLTLLLMMILLCCLCIACCTVLLRLRCRSGRSDSNQLQNVANGTDQNIDEETRMRNQRMIDLRRYQIAN